MADVLAYVERREGRLGVAAFEVVALAARIAGDLGGKAHALIVGGPGASADAAELGRYGASSVAAGEHEALEDCNAHQCANVIATHARQGGYAVVMLSASTAGRDIAPRLAAMLDVPLATDATRVSVVGGRIQVERPVYSGKALALLEFEAAPALVTIRPNAFPPVELSVEGSVSVFTPEVDGAGDGVRVTERRQTPGGSLDVSEASVVVSGGRGLKEASHWTLLEALRDVLGPGTALGASRAVVDAGWRPHAEQVGQTGKTVSPKLYVAIGISGAVQHLAGMRTAKTIVAINRDADAPIFQVADYGIVGDLFEVVPRFTSEIEALKRR